MKKIIFVLMSVLMAAAMIVSVSAAGVESTEILKGTPVVDGVLDEIYTQSVVYAANGADGTYYPMGGFSGTIQHTASAYLLWDNDYLYICTVTEEPTPMSSGDGTWFNDAAEHWLIDEGLNHKVHIAADGTFFMGEEDGDGICAYDFSASKSAATMTDAGWVTEIALPLNNLEAGRTFTYKLQVNDIISAGYGYANTGNPNVDLVCGAAEVVVTEIETPEAETEAPEVVDVPVAPQTFDAGVIAVVAAIVSAAGYMISKKR